MKTQIIRVCFCSLLLAALALNVQAQRSGRKRNNTTQPNSNQQQQTNNTQVPSGYNPYGNIPIEKDTTSASYNGALRHPSLRNDNAFVKNGVMERTPLPYEDLRWDDALFAEKVWRELDLREKLNQTFRYEAEDDNGSQLFVDMLLKAIKQDSITAFADDRFSQPLTFDEVNGLTVGGAPDTTAVYDPNDINKVVKYVVTQKSFDPKSIVKLRIKEEWVFDREASRMFARILGIAPLKMEYLPNGQERGVSVMFWVYYPDLRPLLAKYEVYNPKNMGMGRMTWEELFESRMFSSYIVKSTLDNPGNKTVKQYMRDPILSLLEGDNIKDRIFNYEQDLWSY
ncbi:MAG: gliding motility protein GldN [Bacteroidetes bacterium]|nr:MAG: gliding motility protein GldN [Bacteroidota bacterium]